MRRFVIIGSIAAEKLAELQAQFPDVALEVRPEEPPAAIRRDIEAPKITEPIHDDVPHWKKRGPWDRGKRRRA